MSSVVARDGQHRWPNESPRPQRSKRVGVPARGAMLAVSATAGQPGRDAQVKSLRDEMEIVNAYELVGSYRGAAALCGTTAKTVKRVLERRAAGQVGRRPGPPRERNTAAMAELIRQKVRASDGRISAKRLLPLARAAGYTGSARNFRRAVATAKANWKRERRTYRPWVPVPGEHLVIDWAEEGGRKLFCAVLAWSRYRFVRFGADQTRETTLALLAECFDELGGVPA